MESISQNDSLTKRETSGFWAAAREGRLALPKCDACGRLHWYPRAICPFCLSADIVWQDSPGTGSIYSFTVFRLGGNRPIAYVDLDEGLRILTNIATSDIDRLAIGARVRAEFPDFPVGDLTLPAFRLT